MAWRYVTWVSRRVMGYCKEQPLKVRILLVRIALGLSQTMEESKTWHSADGIYCLEEGSG